MEKTVLVAMSGGVDSSVCAHLLLRSGYDCQGCHMKLWEGTSGREDAEGVCRLLGIPFLGVDLTGPFRREVVDKFVRVYRQGGTPNPCVDCNRCLKFAALLEVARDRGLWYVATGHYARVERQGDRFLLKKALDPAKDQSYFLYMLTQDQLARVLFPLGELTKDQVRGVAGELSFPNARRKDSQDVCFLPDGDYAAFLERYTGQAMAAGDFLDQAGQVVGRHRGAAGYTLGQRRGLGLPMGERIYVVGKDMNRNTVTVGPESALYTALVRANEVNWIVPPTGPFRARAKTRYRMTEQPCTVYPQGETVRVEFDAPQRAVTPGQALVIYDGDLVLGGGTILP